MKYLLCILFIAFILFCDWYDPKYKGPVKVNQCMSWCVFVPGDEERTMICKRHRFIGDAAYLWTNENLYQAKCSEWRSVYE
jgi:hypothetical protein